MVFLPKIHPFFGAPCRMFSFKGKRKGEGNKKPEFPPLHLDFLLRLSLRQIDAFPQTNFSRHFSPLFPGMAAYNQPPISQVQDAIMFFSSLLSAPLPFQSPFLSHILLSRKLGISPCRARSPHQRPIRLPFLFFYDRFIFVILLC